MCVSGARIFKRILYARVGAFYAETARAVEWRVRDSPEAGTPEAREMPGGRT